MNFHRRGISAAALAAALLFAVSGCKSSQPANSANNNQPGTTTAGTQPGEAAPSGVVSAPGPVEASRAPQPPPPPAAVNLPAGTELRVRLDQDLGSKISQPGDGFTATVASDVAVNGATVIPRGARADGTVVDAQPLGRFKGGALLEVRLDRVHTSWGAYPVATSSISRVEKGKGRRRSGHCRRRLHRQPPDRAAGRDDPHLPPAPAGAHCGRPITAAADRARCVQSERLIPGKRHGDEALCICRKRARTAAGHSRQRARRAIELQAFQGVRYGAAD